MLLWTADQFAEHRLPSQPDTAPVCAGVSHSVRERVLHQPVHSHLDGRRKGGVVYRDASVRRRTLDQTGPIRASPRRTRRLVAIYYSSRIITVGTGLVCLRRDSSRGLPGLNASNRGGLSSKGLSGPGAVPSGNRGVSNAGEARSSHGARRRAQDRTAA